MTVYAPPVFDVGGDGGDHICGVATVLLEYRDCARIRRAGILAGDFSRRGAFSRIFLYHVNPPAGSQRDDADGAGDPHGRTIHDEGPYIRKGPAEVSEL